jgi:hypothetical protein
MEICAAPTWLVHLCYNYKFVYSAEKLILSREVALNAVSLRKNLRICCIAELVIIASKYSIKRLAICRWNTRSSCARITSSTT